MKHVLIFTCMIKEVAGELKEKLVVTRGLTLRLCLDYITAISCFLVLYYKINETALPLFTRF